MADIREVFTVLENDSTGAGEKLPARQEGDATAAKNGHIVFGFKDNSGNAVLPALTAGGAVPVDVSGGGTCLSQRAKVTATGGVDDIVTMALTLSKVYNDIELSMSNFKSTAWQLVYIDDVGGTPTETILWEGLTGPGQFHLHINFDCLQFDTNAGTGTQNLVLRGDQQSAGNSDMRGFVAVKEI